MRSACIVRTRFILNIFSEIGLGAQDPPWLRLCAVRIVCSKRHKAVECPSVRRSICLSRRSTAAAAAAGFAAEVECGQEISIGRGYCYDAATCQT